jgi:hypothetical protein
MNTTGPSEEISRSTASASVVLPDPLSPTMPSVSPSRTLTVAAFTAFTWPTVRRKNPRWIGNQTRSASVLTTSAAHRRHGFGAAGRFGRQQPARVGMPRIVEDRLPSSPAPR